MPTKPIDITVTRHDGLFLLHPHTQNGRHFVEYKLDDVPCEGLYGEAPAYDDLDFGLVKSCMEIRGLHFTLSR